MCDFTPNKQGPVGRWDFDNPEDYADYMSTKEALPKAAFQYGVKMAEGRKTGKKVRSYFSKCNNFGSKKITNGP